MTVEIIQGDCRDVLEIMPSASINCIVTSPPYFGLRDYGVAGQQEYFVAYPRCRNFPVSIEYGAEGYWSVLADGLDFYEIAAVYAAIEEITSVPVRVEEYRDNGAGAVYAPDTEASTLVKAEVAELRRLNLWGR